MDNATCNIVYVDANVHRDGVVHNSDAVVNGFEPECELLSNNLKLLRDVFSDIHLCATGAECISTISSLHDSSMIDLKPTLVLIDMPHDEKVSSDPVASRDPSPHSVMPAKEEDHEAISDADMYGLRLLERVVSESQLRNLSRLVAAIPIVRPPPVTNGEVENATDSTAVEALPNGKRRSAYLPNRKLLKRCLDLGAIDVITSPMTEKTLVNLEVQGYRAHKDAAREQQAMMEVRRGRKRSWVGVNEEKPFAYLREAMVSGLMSGICKLDKDNEPKVSGVQVDVPPERLSKIAAAVGTWHFCAHSFSEDELVVAARIMFKHALSMPELAHWRIPTDQLTSFLVACKAAYNNFVPYHNFRHVVDVLQATFHLLVNIGAIKPYPATESEGKRPEIKSSPLGALIQPFEALTLLVTAIGHDVGHPGVNNGFLVTLNSPLAQLYNDRSVLESFHCAAYSQILRRYWPSAFEDTKMRNLMISSILATDMGLHFDYMKRLGDTQEKLQTENTTQGWNGRMVEEQKALVCSLLIKCADISNVARKRDTTLKWMYILNDEFSRQANMESELDIDTSLFAPPKKDPISLYKSQTGFMNIFALPLFQGVVDVMPTLRYTVDELELNKSLFEDKMSRPEFPKRGRYSTEAFSPRTMSLAVDDNAKDQLKESMRLKESLKDTLKNSFPEAPEDATDSSAGPTTMSFETHRGLHTCNDAPVTNGVSDPKPSAKSQCPSSDPFNDDHPLASDKQRCSETTEGSNSAPYSGDWVSQATSATTGKMPLSPSTQGTSIVSRDSIDRPTSIPVTAVTSPDNNTSSTSNSNSITNNPNSNTSNTSNPNSSSINNTSNGINSTITSSPSGKDNTNITSNKLAIPGAPLAMSRTSSTVDDGSNASTNGSPSPQPRRLVKKKSSLFRLNAFNFFRKHKNPTPTPPVPPIPPQVQSGESVS